MIANYLNDARLTNYLRLASLITLSYSFYSVFTGYFNGQKKFFTQAALDITYSTLKLVFILLFVWLGYGGLGESEALRWLPPACSSSLPQ